MDEIYKRLFTERRKKLAQKLLRKEKAGKEGEEKEEKEEKDSGRDSFTMPKVEPHRTSNFDKSITINVIVPGDGQHSMGAGNGIKEALFKRMFEKRKEKKNGRD